MKVYKFNKVEEEDPLFFPALDSAEQAQEEVIKIVNRSPMDYGIHSSTWKLHLLKEELIKTGKFRLKSISGVWQLLKRIGLSYQRARDYIRSPDIYYNAKWEYIQNCIGQYDTVNPDKVVILFVDELTYYNHASRHSTFALKTQQPLAQQAIGGTKQNRVLGALNLFTGQLTTFQRTRIKMVTLVSFFKELQIQYPNAQTIYLIIDNWPVHYHPEVIHALEKQRSPFELKIPSSWSNIKPTGKYYNLNLPIQFVPLPTYASWLNPIEKVWKWLKKEIIHLHQFAHRFKELRPAVQGILDKLNQPNLDMLNITGLKNSKGIYAQSLSNSIPDFFRA